MTIEIDFLQKKNIDSNPYDTDKMAAEFIQQFNSQAFSVGQQVWILFWFFKAKMFLSNMRMLLYYSDVRYWRMPTYWLCAAKDS